MQSARFRARGPFSIARMRANPCDCMHFYPWAAHGVDDEV